MTKEARLAENQGMVEAWLEAYLNRLETHGDLVDAMRYSLLSGGKRIRPILTLEACRFCGGTVEQALPLACALEMIHTYSLIHDDLPCMDDDDLRRGRPTNHRVYGEATAVLAGDALLTAAFCVLSEAQGLEPSQIVAAVHCLSKAAGCAGMVGGQVLDMAGEGRALTFDEVKEIESLKTGAMIVAAVRLGCIAAGGSPAQEQALVRYAERVGLAFQIQDDVLDVEGEETLLGKSVGSDANNEKATFVFLKGVDACRTMVRSLSQEAMDALRDYEENDFLCWLAKQLEERKK